jgi:hypothetical protein
VRADIAKFIYEQQHGKATARVDVGLTAREQTERAIASAIVLDDGLPQGHLAIIDGEIVDEDEPDDI